MVNGQPDDYSDDQLAEPGIEQRAEYGIGRGGKLVCGRYFQSS